MAPADRGEEVRVERGAVLVIVGCVFLYLALLALARYRGRSEPAHLVAGLFILYAAWTLAAGFLGLLDRPRSTPMAGAAYAVGGWVLASAAARSLVGGVGWTSVLVVALAVPLVVVAEVYGVALVRGFERPEEADTWARRVADAVESLRWGGTRKKL